MSGDECLDRIIEYLEQARRVVNARQVLITDVTLDMCYELAKIVKQQQARIDTLEQRLNAQETDGR